MCINKTEEFVVMQEIAIPTLTRSIIGTMNYVWLMTVGNGLCVLIIDYERNGGDPQKRTVLNQLISFISMCLIGQAIIAGTIAEVVTLTGPVGLTIGSVFIATHFTTSLACLLSIAEQVVIRCLMLVWKNVSILNDDFFGFFLKLFNLVLASAVTSVFMILNLHINNETVRLIGNFEGLDTSR